MSQSETLGALAAALIGAQSAFEGIDKDRQAGGGSRVYKYADLSACLAAVGPALRQAGIALLQPTRTEFGESSAVVIATTLLIHAKSGEWYSSDFGVGVSDPSDAQAIGSAATYARRYGLKAVLAIEAEEADDDGVAARGGDHPMKSHGAVKACPVCGKTGTVLKSREEGQGWFCWAKRGGCGTKWPEGPFPAAAPPIDPTPTEKVVAIGAKAPYAHRAVDTTTGELIERLPRGEAMAQVMAWETKLGWKADKRAEARRKYGVLPDPLTAPQHAFDDFFSNVKLAAIAAGIEGLQDEVPF